MARTDTLSIGDIVDFCGKRCRVVEILTGTSVIAVQCDGPKGFVSYIYARDCKKVA